MPKRDRTGPKGRGPGTGRKRGGCFGVFRKKDGSISVWRTLVFPMIGAIINDLRKPDSISRRTVNAIANHLKPKKITDAGSSSHEIKAPYSVIDNEKGERYATRKWTR